ncbi:MAG: sugar transferase [Magnetococcales bacterium]|uniref:Sugar transferase n=1 Tax=Candidatus Magnetobacterium casense TaxID=1455061 RepID=A0ABS6RWM8_9BACT|nr:sugar transferase [Candidatus Magnetobacterium casensis]MBF0607337.1 sugar transferase [Nitrospirota bacterium]MBV6340991.1 sugar transferase [Candidatus Magnetobacterium casensis]
MKQGAIKATIDRVLSLLLVFLLFPLMLIIGILVKLDSRGPVFFMQRRCGLGGEEFLMYKFRTMVQGADDFKDALSSETDGPVFKIKKDPRVTRIGRILRRWSLDELPQLLNVLSGQMSLVGPRPLENVEMQGNDHWRTVRLSVKPGITGLWQIYGRDSCKFSDWIKYDVEYVQNMSLRLDIRILLTTTAAIVRKKGT